MKLKYSKIATNSNEPEFTGPPDDVLFHRQKDIVGKTFSDYMVELAWARCGGRCECTQKSHKHLAERCIQRLDKHCRGKDLSTAWQAHKINPNAPPVLRNCKVLCLQCYLKIQRSNSYAGRDQN